MAYNVAQALKDGLSEEEIAKHLAKTRNYRFDEAIKAGVPHREIIEYLAPQKPIGQKPTSPVVPFTQRPREPVVPAIETPVTPPEKPAQMPTLGISPPGVMGVDVMRHRPSPVTAEIDLTEIPKELTPSHEPFRPTLGVPPAEPSKDFGLRPDGTPKGTGFLGVLKRPDGKVSSEISIGVNIDGKEVEIPTLVPTLAQDEINYLLSGGKPTDAIIGKAAEHAKSRMAKGLSPFAQEEERAGAERVAPTKIPPKPFFGVKDTISGVWDAVSGLGTVAPAAFYQLVEGMERPDKYSESAKVAFAKADARAKEMESKTLARQKAGISTSVGESFREAGQSLGFSLASMAAAMPAFMGGAKVGGIAGGVILGPPGAAVGATVAGTASALLASGTAAYRMAGAMFLKESFDLLDAESQRKSGRPMNEREKQSAFEALLPIAKNTALWEAGPEAVGNAVMLGAGKIVFGLGKPLMLKFGSSILGKAAVAAGATATEVGGETLTQVEQRADQLKAQALAEGKDPDAIKADWTIGGAVEAFKEVAPQTLALMGLMAGAGGATKATVSVADKLRKPPIPTGPEPIGSTIPAPGQPPVTAKPPVVSPAPQPIPPIMGMGQEMEVSPPPVIAKPPLETKTQEEAIGTTISPPPQPKPIEAPAPTTPIPQMMGMGQPGVAPVPTPPATDVKKARAESILREIVRKDVEEATALPPEEFPILAEKEAIGPFPAPEVTPQAQPVAQELPEQIQPAETLVEGKVSPEAPPISEEELEKPLVPVIPPSEWQKDPVLVADADAVVNRINNEYPDAGLLPEDLEYQAVQKFGDQGMHMWNVNKPDHPKFQSAVYGPIFKLSPEQVETAPQPISKEGAERVPPTAQDLELMPEEYPEIDKVAMMQDGKVYTDSVHGEIMVNNNLDPERAIRGYTTKGGEFVPAEKVEGIAPEAKVEVTPSEKVPEPTQMREKGVSKPSPEVPFQVDDKLTMHSPYTDEDTVVNYRGPGEAGKAVVWTGKTQIQVPIEWLSRPTPEAQKADTSDLSETSAKKLLSLPYEMRTSPSGDQNAKFRQQILKELTGQDLPKNKAGAGKVREELTKAAGIDTTGKAPVEIDREIHEWLQGIAGVEKKAEVTPIAATLPPGVGTVPKESAKEIATTTPPGVPTIRAEKTEGSPVQVVPPIIPIGQQVRVVEPPPLVEGPVEEPTFPITSEAFKEFDKPFSDFDLNTIPEEMIIKVQAIREETGKPVEIYENAREAIKDHRGKMKQFKSLLDCIGA